MKEYETAAWCDGMRLKINYNNTMKSALIPNGFTAEEIKALPLENEFAAMMAKREQLKWRELPHNQAELAARPAEDPAYIL